MNALPSAHFKRVGYEVSGSWIAAFAECRQPIAMHGQIQKFLSVVIRLDLWLILLSLERITEHYRKRLDSRLRRGQDMRGNDFSRQVGHPSITRVS